MWQRSASGELRWGASTSSSEATHRYDRHRMLTEHLHRAGLRAWQMQISSLSSIGLCVVLWIRAKTVDQDERGNAERRALFVGLWPPMFWLMGDTAEHVGRQEHGRRQHGYTVSERGRIPREISEAYGQGR